MTPLTIRTDKIQAKGLEIIEVLLDGELNALEILACIALTKDAVEEDLDAKIETIQETEALDKPALYKTLDAILQQHGAIYRNGKATHTV